MEPERKIEKLLRAYAKKRRGQSGGSFDLHPATRRLLQGEIAKKSPAPKDEEESSSLWEVFRRDWAFLLGFAACIFFVAAVFFHGLDLSTYKKASVTEAMNHLKDLNSAAQYAAGEHAGKFPASLDDLTNELVTKEMLSDPQSKKPFVFAAAGKNLKDLSSNSVLAYSPEDKEGRAVLFADGRVVYANKKEFDEITNAAKESLVAMNNVQSLQPETGLPAASAGYAPIAESAPAMQPIAPPPQAIAAPEPSVAPAPTMAKVPPPPTMTPPASVATANDSLATQAPVAQPAPASAADMPGVSGGEHAQTFASSRLAVENVQNNFRNMVVPAQKISVLANFQVQQNGDAIRVVDEDGSVYNGSWQIVNNLTNREEIVTDRRNQYQNALTKVAGGSVTNPAAPPPAIQSYFFFATGMNRTLKQTVAFMGTLSPTPMKPAAAESFWQNYGTDQRKDDSSANRDIALRQSEHNAEAAQLPWASFQINGTAIINNSNQIQIVASPVTSTNR